MTPDRILQLAAKHQEYPGALQVTLRGQGIVATVRDCLAEIAAEGIGDDLQARILKALAQVDATLHAPPKVVTRADLVAEMEARLIAQGLGESGAELDALTGLLIDKGVFTAREFTDKLNVALWRDTTRGWKP